MKRREFIKGTTFGACALLMGAPLLRAFGFHFEVEMELSVGCREIFHRLLHDPFDRIAGL